MPFPFYDSLFGTSMGFIGNVKLLISFFQFDKMNKKCLCRHNFNDHIRGPIKEIMHTSGFTLDSAEIRLDCKKCNCSRYDTKRSLVDKFWNGSE